MNRMLLVIIILLGNRIYAQEKVSLYNPTADAQYELQQAIIQAGHENKHVLVQVGGNWCPWCIRLHNFFQSEPVIDSILKADYIIIRINFSKENKNPGIMATLGHPERFGFPVLVVIDSKGTPLHIQDTGYLELGKAYDTEKVKRFLLGWNRAALDPATYQP